MPHLQYIAPQRALNRLAGFLANHTSPWLKNRLIRYFLGKYPVNLAEAEVSDPLVYDSFNHFFTRALKAGARPVASEKDDLASPVDGCISTISTIKQQQLFQAKGHTYRLSDLLGGETAYNDAFEHGSFINAYLAPKDYHRVHMPIDGHLVKMIYVPGELFSVNPVTCQKIPNLFARNERVVAIFETAIGPMAMVLVGAMIVGHIETVWAGTPVPSGNRDVQHVAYAQPIFLRKGEEMGRFRLGSTVIALFPAEKVTWDARFKTGTALRMGECLGKLSL